MTISSYSDACVALVKRFEGLYLTAYLCPAGCWTIGWGHTDMVRQGQQITEDQAEAFLQEDLSYVANTLISILPSGAPINQNQFDSLASLSFNLLGGARALPRKAPKMWKDLVSGNLQDAAVQFLDMDHALVNGSVVELPGLKARRIAEAALFNTPVYEEAA
jgi:lysozyme